MQLSDGHFLVWKLHQNLKALEGLRWNISGHAYRESFEMDVSWQAAHAERTSRLSLAFRSHHPIHRDEYCEWVVQAVVAHVAHGIEPPNIDGEPGYELRSYDSSQPRVLVDFAPFQSDALLGGEPDADSGEEPPSDDGDGGDADHVDTEAKFVFPTGAASDLYVTYGYTVAKKTGLSVSSRRKRLEIAIGDLGVASVAGHLRGLIKRNSRGGSALWFRAALKKWRSDVAWVEANFRAE